jgi:hypothetical protein
VNQKSIKEKLKQNFTISASNERFIFLWANVFNRFKYFTVLIISTKFVQCSNWTVQNSCVFRQQHFTMFKTIALTLALAGVTQAYCPNGCSGHGTCSNGNGMKDKCSCFTHLDDGELVAMWTGADCSLRKF